MPDAWGGSFGSSCSEGVCGTGGWTGPKPGDPDNNSILSAVAAYGGIDVSWSYPSTNPAAVAHTLLYRGITSDYPLATLRQVVAGSFFYDRIAKADIKEYFYWIQIVSINGTVGELIGPASATPMSSIEETIQDLTGLIDAGVLAQSLKTEIARIGTIDTSLAQEVLNRIGANNALADAMAQVQSDTGQAMTLILDEVNQRVTADDAMITSVNAMMAGINGDYAAIVEQQSVLVDADEALAASVLTAQSVLNGNIASVQTSLQTNINTLDGEVTNIGALYTAKVDVNGLIGGFGIYNDGTEVEAGFDVDRFWIGRTTNKRKPFIIDSGVVYIDDAAINKLTFNKLRDESGSFLVEGGRVKAAYLKVDNASITDLAVSTLKIQGNAVTVPVSSSRADVIAGNGGYQSVSDLWLTSDVAVGMHVLGLFTARTSYASGIRTTGYRVLKDGGVLVDWGVVSGAYADFPSFQFLDWVPANTSAHYEVQFYGGDSTVSINYRTLTALGAKR